MNNTTPYEQLIAAKLDQVPVPDMSDSIWAGIEAQLDVATDMPAKKPSSRFSGKGWFGFAGVIIAVTFLWWHFSHKDHTAPRETVPVKAEPAPVKDSNRQVYPAKKKEIPFSPLPVKKDTPALNLNEIAHPDSAFRQSTPVIKKDSPALRIYGVPYHDSISIAPAPKKPKGVKGISDDDYRISSGKDTAKKGN